MARGDEQRSTDRLECSVEAAFADGWDTALERAAAFTREVLRLLPGFGGHHADRSIEPLADPREVLWWSSTIGSRTPRPRHGLGSAAERAIDFRAVSGGSAYQVGGPMPRHSDDPRPAQYGLTVMALPSPRDGLWLTCSVEISTAPDDVPGSWLHTGRAFLDMVALFGRYFPIRSGYAAGPDAGGKSAYAIVNLLEADRGSGLMGYSWLAVAGPHLADRRPLAPDPAVLAEWRPLTGASVGGWAALSRVPPAEMAEVDLRAWKRYLSPALPAPHDHPNRAFFAGLDRPPSALPEDWTVTVEPG